MPNHITNILSIVSNSEEQVLKILKYIKDDELGMGSIDFNKITKMPDWVFQDNLGREDEEKYGRENCWYGWSINNWGTKWNAYDQISADQNYNTNNYANVIFCTAWSNVIELIKKLSLIFRDTTFYYEWASEEYPYYQGEAQIRDGEIMYSIIPPNGTRYAFDIASRVMGIDPWEMGYVFHEKFNNYIYNRYNDHGLIEPIKYLNNYAYPVSFLLEIKESLQ